MGRIQASAETEIDAAIETIWELVADVPRAPEWQDGLLRMDVLERDAEGRAVLCESTSDAKVRELKSVVRFAYQEPQRLSWSQESGDLKSVSGYWELEDLGDGRTRATYSQDIELPRMLELVVRGPIIDVIKGQLVNARPGELKAAIETA